MNKKEKVTKPGDAMKGSEENLEEVVNDNLRFYNRGRSVPADALKEIRAGRLKGMSDVNPMWRMKRLTEIFGPVGFGWKYTIDKQWEETFGSEVKCFCNVSLYVKDPQTKEWSEAIPGIGGSAIVSMESKGAYVNDEGYKMALTDALSIAMKPLGIGADIWYGEKAKGHNESKYEQYTNVQLSQPDPKEIEEMNIRNAMADIQRAQTRQELQAAWKKWNPVLPHLFQPKAMLYNEFALKGQELNNQKTA